ncbi:hypothetical protein CKO42_24130 [Lamprobacter modestohalophilus]|uniref:Uncharacterized protein n=1 Tax=Lamprobacter modestohalophilus TaxID=1064514 RepID=A0A9X0WDE6_9GAMM|nr:hypothetical protein [Lamprobacter modestohalophilus]
MGLVRNAVLLNRRPQPLQPALATLSVHRRGDDEIDQLMNRLVDRIAQGTRGGVHLSQRRPKLLHQQDGPIRRDQRIDPGNRLDLGERLLEPLRGQLGGLPAKGLGAKTRAKGPRVGRCLHGCCRAGDC